MDRFNQLGLIFFVILVSFISAQIFFYATSVAYFVSSHPLISLLMRLLFLFILSLLVILKKRENVVYLFVWAFPFLKISFNGISVLIIFAFLFLFLYFKEIVAYLAHRKDIFVMPFIILFVSMIYATVMSQFPLESLGYLVFFLCLFVIYVVLTILFKDDVIRKNILMVLIVILLLCVFVSISQIIFGIGKIKLFFGNYGNNVNIYGDSTRPPSIFWEAQFAGLYFALMTFVCLGVVNLFLRRSFAVFLCIFAIFAMVLTGTRMAFLSLLCGFIFIQMFSINLKKLFLAAFAILLCLTFIRTGYYKHVVPLRMQQRISVAQVIHSFNYRFDLWKRSFSILQSNPLGIGMGGSNVYSAASKHHVYAAKQYQHFDNPTIGTQFDSTYLDILYPLGVLGFLGFFYVFYVFISAGLKIYVSRFDIRSRGFILCLMACMVCWMVGITTSHVFYDNQAMVFFLIVVALLSAEYNKFKEMHLKSTS